MIFRNLLTVLVTVIIGLALPHAGLLEADAAKVAFVSPPQTVAPGMVSEQITIQTQDASGNEFKMPSTACAALSSTSSGGAFSSNPDNWESVTALTIAKNSANRNFYYKDASEGAHTIRVRVVIRPEGESRSCASWPLSEWPSGFDASQTITIGSAGASPPPSSTATSSLPGGTGSSQSSSSATSQTAGGGGYEPRIFVSALVPNRSAAGAPVFFDATAIGLKKEPLPNARYVWSFGDGGTAEGKKVSHTYHYPASYTVMVTTSSGEWSATDRKEIGIFTPELVLSNVRAGSDGFIELRNDGTGEVNLSFWILTSSARTFVIPEGTLVGAGKSVPFPAAITGLLADPLSTALLYPNGNPATVYIEKRPAAPPPLSPAPVLVAPQTPKGPPIAETAQAVAREKREEAPTGALSPQASNGEEEKIASPASSTALAFAAGAAEGSGMTPWALGVALLAALSVGGYLFFSHKEANLTNVERLKREAAEYDIVE